MHVARSSRARAGDAARIELTRREGVGPGATAAACGEVASRSRRLEARDAAARDLAARGRAHEVGAGYCAPPALVAPVPAQFVRPGGAGPQGERAHPPAEHVEHRGVHVARRGQLEGEPRGKTECWYAIMKEHDDQKNLVSDHMTIDLTETEVGRQMIEFYHSDQKQISIPMRGDSRKEWINYCADHSEVLVGFYGNNIPDRTYHLYKFTNGFMGVASPGQISNESWALLQRATNVFSLAYTRFSDLQQAEINAREAIKQAALDRVRAEIASMRTTDDLDRITPLIWNELTILGIPFIRCGVFIMDDTQQLIHTFLSTPDGKAIAAFHLPYTTSSNIDTVVDHWHHKKIYAAHWDKAAFIVAQWASPFLLFGIYDKMVKLHGHDQHSNVH